MYVIIVDLETMGTKPGCVITEIGAIVVNLDRPGDFPMSFNEIVDYTASRKAGFRADKKTMQWWAKRLNKTHLVGHRKELEQAFAEQWRSPHSIRKAIAHFTEFYADVVEMAGSSDNVVLMGNDIDFDKCILEHYYTAISHEPPWHYRAWISLPTMVWLIKRLTGVDIKARVREYWKTSHTALDDARQEAAMVSEGVALLSSLRYTDNSKSKEIEQ